MRSRLTFANVTSVLALFFALGGSAYALSVSGDDVVNNSLTGADIAKNSIKASDIAGPGANVVVRTGNTGSGSLFASSQANCNKGETAISGGYGTAGQSQLPSTIFDQPVPTSGKPTGWQVTVALQNPAGSNVSVTAFVLCAS